MRTHLQQVVFVLLLSLCSIVVKAQIPALINYQAVARNASGQILSNQSIALRLTVHQSTTTGTTQYQERHAITTNAQGLCNVQIGGGTVLSGTFAGITWADGQPKYLQMELDPAGGTSYTNMGTQQLVSVPYSLYAKEAATATNDNDTNPSNELQTLSLSGNSLALSNGGGTVTLPTGTTYTAGTGISLAGNVVTNTAPNQAVSLTGAGVTTISGTYPNFTVTTPAPIDNSASNELQTLSLSGNSLTLSNGGGTVTLPSGSSGWSLTGNAGTNAATNFIGTTDSQPLQFRANNIKAGYIANGISNTALGISALGNVDNSSNNTVMGYQSLYSNNTGSNNTALGTEALLYNVSGNSNVAIGIHALYSNTDRSNLVAVGDSALFNNGIGAVGLEGMYNTAIGSKALFANTTGIWNTANGYHALYSNTTGEANTANGIDALAYNTTGSSNTANGNSALYLNTTGAYNTANGGSALAYNTTGYNNTANGNFALNFNTTGAYNTANGYNALNFNTIGDYNTCMGTSSNVSLNNLIDASAFGALALVNATHKIVLGQNIGGMVIGGYANWSNLSDGRFKQQVQSDVPGLSFIGRLRPVTYRVNLAKLQRHLTAQLPDSIARRYYPTPETISAANAEVRTGFIAQEVEASAKEIGYEFDGINAPKNPTDNYSLEYAGFVPSLVKAVQEQQAMIEALKEKADKVVAENQQIKAELAQIKQLLLKLK